MAPAGSAATAVGGRLRWVIPCVAISSASGSPGSRCSAVASTRVPPDSSASTSSQNAPSKLSEANCSTRASGPAPSRSRCTRTMSCTPVWVTTTALGRPVEPEV